MSFPCHCSNCGYVFNHSIFMEGPSTNCWECGASLCNNCAHEDESFKAYCSLHIPIKTKIIVDKKELNEAIKDFLESDIEDVFEYVSIDEKNEIFEMVKHKAFDLSILATLNDLHLSEWFLYRIMEGTVKTGRHTRELYLEYFVRLLPQYINRVDMYQAAERALEFAIHKIELHPASKPDQNFFWRACFGIKKLRDLEKNHNLSIK